MDNSNPRHVSVKLVFLFVLLFLFTNVARSFADITINLLAVNGTEYAKEKKIYTLLPKELTQEDILETDGLELKYDVDSGSYAVAGNVELEPKESRKYQIRIRDLWQVNREEIEEIKEQINQSISRLEGSEYYENSLIKRENLLKRLEYIADEQERFSDNVEARMDRYRVYPKDLDQMRDNVMSVNYWRAQPYEPTENNRSLTFIIEVENGSSGDREVKRDYCLPVEVKPEHLLETQGFEYRFDPVKEQPYLLKEETLSANETKRYTISIRDVWHIVDKDMENLRDRTRNAYKFLEKTIYGESAKYLVESIKKGLDKIEEVQAVERSITEHINVFRRNRHRFEKAEKDVEALEEMLEAIREDLERSKVKNVLKKIKKLKTIKEIAEAVFKKPEFNIFWKIVVGILIFIGLYNIIHFSIWSKRSRDKRREELENKDELKQDE